MSTLLKAPLGKADRIKQIWCNTTQNVDFTLHVFGQFFIGEYLRNYAARVLFDYTKSVKQSY